MLRYLVTGGAGFIGSAITQKLIDQGNYVRVFDNEFRGSKDKLKSNSNLEFVQGDIRIYRDVHEACKNINRIIHLAYINGTKNFYEKPDLVLEVGVKGIINILDAAKAHGVEEFFLASSSEVYQNPDTIPTPENVPLVVPDPYNPRFSYGGGKIISELLTIHMGKTIFKRSIIFRPHNVYGPAMGFEHVVPELIRKISTAPEKGNLLIQGSGEETRSFMYIDDFVDGLHVVLEKGENMETYNIGTDEETTIKTLAEILISIAGKKLQIATSPTQQGSPGRRCPDITKLRALGFKPKTSLNKGLQESFLWYNAHYSRNGKT